MALELIPTGFRFPPSSKKTFVVGIHTDADNTGLQCREITGGQLANFPVHEDRVANSSSRSYLELVNRLLDRIPLEPRKHKKNIVGIALGTPVPFNEEIEGIADFLHSHRDIPVFVHLNCAEGIAWGLTEDGTYNITDDLNPPSSNRTSTDTFAVLAQGVSLEQSSANVNGDRVEVFSSEGARAYLPISVDDKRIVQLGDYLGSKHKRPAQATDALSRSGIVDTYLFVSGKDKLPDSIANSDNPAAVIFRQALDGDNDCQEAVKLFVKTYGAHARNFTLAVSADTVFLAGDAYSQRELLTRDGVFTRAFLGEPGFEDSSLKSVRVGIVDPESIGETGGTIYLRNLFHARGYIKESSTPKKRRRK